MKPLPNPRSPRRRGAFSLLEILVAVTLLMVIISALLLTFNQTQRAFRMGVNQTDVLEGGRTATLLLSRELQAIATTATRNSLDLLVLLPNSAQPLELTLAGNESRWTDLEELTFVSRVNDDWYVTAYRVLHGGLGVGALYRWTARTNYDGVPALFSEALNWRPDPARDSRVLDGVVHFRFVPFVSVGSTKGLRLSPIPLSIGGGGEGYVFPDFRTTNALPTDIEMELGILEPQTLAAVRARTDIPTFDARAFLKERPGRVHLFRQRIPVRATLPPNSTLFSP